MKEISSNHRILPAAMSQIADGKKARARSIRIVLESVSGISATFAVQTFDKEGKALSELCKVQLDTGNDVTILNLNEVFKINIVGG